MPHYPFRVATTLHVSLNLPHHIFAVDRQVWIWGNSLVVDVAHRALSSIHGLDLRLGARYDVQWKRNPGLTYPELLSLLSHELRTNRTLPIAILFQAKGDGILDSPLHELRSKTYEFFEVVRSLNQAPILVWSEIPPHSTKVRMNTIKSLENKRKKLNRLARSKVQRYGADVVANTLAPDHYWLFQEDEHRELSVLGLDCLLGAWVHRLQELLM